MAQQTENNNMTAVEWIVEEINKISVSREATLFIEKLRNQAKQMEKEQIMKAVDRGFDEGCKHPEDVTLRDAEQYYNETYGKD